MRALALLALCLPATALAGSPLDKYEGSVGEVQIDGVVELPLHGGVYGDEIPYVLVSFGEDDEAAWLFAIDLGSDVLSVSSSVADQKGSGVKTKNKKFFASLGKKKDKAAYGWEGKHQVTSIDQINLAEGLVLYDVDAQVGAPDTAPLLTTSPEATTVFGSIGIGALGIPVAILPSEGVIRFAPPDQGQQLLDAVGGTVFPYQSVDSVKVKTWAGKQALPGYYTVIESQVNGQPALLSMSTGAFPSVLRQAVALADGPRVPVADATLAYTPVTLGGVELEADWVVQRDHAATEVAYPGEVVGSIGYNFLADYDIAIDPASGQIAMRAATAQQRAWPLDAFIDAVAKELEALDAPAEDGQPVEKTEEDLEAEKKKRAGLLGEKAYLHLVGGDAEQGIALMEEATGLEPDPCEMWAQLAQAYTLGHRFDDAAVAAQKGMDRFLAWSALSTEEREEIEKMDDEEREASGVQPQNLDGCHEIPGMVAYYQLVGGELDKAVATYEEHVDLHPGIGIVAGIAHLLAEDDDLAQGPLRHTLNLGARSATANQGYLNPARIALAELYRRQGDIEQAIAHWKREQASLAGDPFAVQQYADLVAEQSDAAGAMKAMQELASSYPENPVVKVVLAKTMVTAGHEAKAGAPFEAANERLDELLALRPHLGPVYGLQAWALVEQGDFDGAKAAAEKALELTPTEGYAHWALMKIAEDQGPMPKALKHYKLAKSHNMGHYFFATLEKPRMKIRAKHIRITEKALEIPEKVFFQTGSAVIDERSYGLLDAVAEVLGEHPELLKLSVEGHTDADGDDASNKELSQARAQAVLDYLVEKGVEAERLEAQGWGEEKPIGSNDTDEGKAANRRVEFLIVKKKK